LFVWCRLVLLTVMDSRQVRVEMLSNRVCREHYRQLMVCLAVLTETGCLKEKPTRLQGCHPVQALLQMGGTSQLALISSTLRLRRSYHKLLATPLSTIEEASLLRTLTLAHNHLRQPGLGEILGMPLGTACSSSSSRLCNSRCSSNSNSQTEIWTPTGDRVRQIGRSAADSKTGTIFSEMDLASSRTPVAECSRTPNGVAI